MNKRDSNWFKSVIEQIGYATRSYSGRGMYGNCCLGVELEKPLGRFFADLLQEWEYRDDLRYQVAVDAFNSMKTDSMGLGIIVYFEDVQWTDEDTDLSEEDEEPSESQPA